MAWEWSHTQEAYEYVRCRLYKMAKAKLHVIWAEWKTYHHAQEVAQAEAEAEGEELLLPSDDFDQDYYKTQLKEARQVSKKVGTEPLADDIWNWASNFATCTNGGHQAWMCPYGCDPHMVPFGPKEKN